MKCFPLLPCYGGPVVEVRRNRATGEATIIYQRDTILRMSVEVGVFREHELPRVGDVVVIHGPTVSWMTPQEFNEANEVIPDVAQAAE